MGTPRTVLGWIVVILVSSSIASFLFWLFEKFVIKSSPINTLWILSILLFVLSFIVVMYSSEIQGTNASTF